MLSRRSFLQGAALLAVAPALNMSSATAQVPAKRPGQAPGFFRMMLGDVEVTAVYDGVVKVPATVLQGARPKVIADLLEYGFTNPGEDIPVAVNAFLVNTGSNLVLVDTGAGAFSPLTGLLPENIRAAGYAPEDIDTVLLTHLHMDHALGLVDGGGSAVFPRATVWVGQADADHWLNDALADASPERMKAFLKKLKAALAPYSASGRFKPFAAGETVMAGIEVVPLLGHTPGHHGFRVSSTGQSLLLWGDIMHDASVQFPRPEVTATFDVDQPRARSTRKALLPELVAGETWVAGAHLPFPGIGRIRPRGRGYSWIPAQYRVPPLG